MIVRTEPRVVFELLKWVDNQGWVLLETYDSYADLMDSMPGRVGAYRIKKKVLDMANA